MLRVVVNPDGYEYTWSGGKTVKKRYVKGAYEEVEVGARLFRKNRRVNIDGSYGVDLNRNFGTKGRTWGIDKKSKSINLTESDIYQGTDAFSEPETAAVRDYLHLLRGSQSLDESSTVLAVLDVHCCIPAVLEPFSPRTSEPANSLWETGHHIVQAMNSKLTNKAYSTGEAEKYSWRPRSESTTSGSGLSTAFFYHDQQIPFVYVIELRGKFVMPCTEIKALGAEVLIGLQVLMKEAFQYDVALQNDLQDSISSVLVSDENPSTSWQAALAPRSIALGNRWSFETIAFLILLIGLTLWLLPSNKISTQKRAKVSKAS